MDKKTGNNPIQDQDKPLLTAFLHELNIARRKLSLYPPEHPQITVSVENTLNILNELFRSNPIISLGISPDTLYFEQLWLDKEDSTNQEFAKFFFSLGIASISFCNGLTGSELIRFNQLLRTDAETIESFGGLDKLLEQQHIDHISVVPIDYDAFQAGQNLEGETQQLWESFVHGLHNGILDFGDSDSGLDLETIADIFNQKLLGNTTEREQYSHSIGQFVENSLQQETHLPSYHENSQKFVSLLEHLNPEAQQEFLSSALPVLDRHREKASDLLQKIPTPLLQSMLSNKNQRNPKISSRMFTLINNLAGDTPAKNHHNIKTTGERLSEDMVRARLDILFNEEQQDLYMPDNYQTALQNILSEEIIANIPDEKKEQLKAQIEEQSVERQYVAIIFEILHDQLDAEEEESIQQNLLDLSRYFLDTGDFVSLREIYNHWSTYLFSGHAAANIFDEKVLSNHTQSTFMAEVMDGIEYWEDEKHQEIADYITVVGEPYTELVIEQLGLAPKLSERQLWMQVLEGIGGDAQQMILRSLQDQRWYLVRNLLIILGKHLDQHNIRWMHRLLDHPHPKVRLEVIRNLFSCNPATANRQLLKELQSDDYESRLMAVQLANLSHDPAVLSILHKKLETDPGGEADLEFKKQIIQALTRIGNKESLPVLRRILLKQGLLVSRRFKQLHAEILKNLSLFPGPAVDKLLNELVGSKHKQLAKLAIEHRKEYARRSL